MTQPDLVPRGLNMRQAVVVSSAVAIPSALIGAAGLAQTGRNGPQWGDVHGLALVGIRRAQHGVCQLGARLSQRMDKHKLQMTCTGVLALVVSRLLLL